MFGTCRLLAGPDEAVHELAADLAFVVEIRGRKLSIARMMTTHDYK
jgi:hypothetical protein